MMKPVIGKQFLMESPGCSPLHGIITKVSRYCVYFYWPSLGRCGELGMSWWKLMSNRGEIREVRG